MQKELIKKPDIKLVGIAVRTNNKSEMNPETAKIGTLVAKYFSQNIAAQISDRKNPGVTITVYTNYDSNEHGDYTCFVGEEVNSFVNLPAGLEQLTIPAAQYQKFTTAPGQMPAVIINAWQEIWKMSPTDFGGERAYQADFEVYDQRASDPTNAVVDIFIGIK